MGLQISLRAREREKKRVYQDLDSQSEEIEKVCEEQNSIVAASAVASGVASPNSSGGPGDWLRLGVGRREREKESSLGVKESVETRVWKKMKMQATGKYPLGQLVTCRPVKFLHANKLCPDQRHCLTVQRRTPHFLLW